MRWQDVLKRILAVLGWLLAAIQYVLDHLPPL